MSVSINAHIPTLLSLMIVPTLQAQDDPLSLNNVPMLGRKRTNSGMMEDKRSPWTGAWANIMASKPDPIYRRLQERKRSPWMGQFWAHMMASKPGKQQEGKRSSVDPGAWTNLIKRTAAPTDWRLGYDNLLRSPQGFRLHDGDYFARDLMYKRTQKAKDVTSQEDNTEIKLKKNDALEIKKKKDEEVPSIVEDQDETTAETDLLTLHDWLDNFQSLMDDVSLVRPGTTLLTRVQRR